MEYKEKILLAQMQIDNIIKLTEEGQYAAFIKSHLLPVKYELQRQAHLLTNTNHYNRIEE